MQAPQIILLLMLGLGLGVKACLHGEERKISFPAGLLDALLLLGLLAWGGFFDA